MTDTALSLAALNVTLLEAIKAGPAAGSSELAERAGLIRNNIPRKIESLLAAGLIAKTGDGAFDLEVTEAGERGLGAMAVFRGGVAEAAGTADLLYIPENRLIRWADNPRTEAGQDADADEDFTLSIADRGVETPITVRAKGDDFEVIHGDRRRRGAQRAVALGLATAGFLVPARLRNLTDDEAYISAGVENLQREDMHWMDEARWLKGLADRGRSGAEIERLVGGRRKKRSIQDYIKCARELPPADIARAYLPEGAKDQLTYVNARDLVGEKKERPALELSPKLAVALLETIACGIAQSERDSYVSAGPLPMPALGATVVTHFAKAPAGGPLATLSTDRKLIVFGFEAGQVVARAKVTEDVARWLGQLAFDTDPHGALWRARAAVIGELQTNVMERDGRCLTDELNRPAPPAQSTQTVMMAELEREFGEDEDEHDPDDGDAEASADASAAARAPDPTPAAPAQLPPMLAIVVVEAAHKISALGMERGPGTWATPVLAKYYMDARGSQLVTGWKMLAFLPMGEKTLVALGKAGRDWLWEKFGVEAEDGHCAVSDAVLQRAQAEFGVSPLADQPYSTFWLNPPAEAEPAAAPDAAAPPDPLTPPQRRALREIAARSLHRHRLLDGWVLAHEAALTDPDFVALWDLAFITRREVRDATVEVALTLSGRDHLKAHGQAPQDGLSRNSCATPWLRETVPDAQGGQSADDGPLVAEGEGGAGAALAPHRDKFSSDIIAVMAETRAMGALAAANRQAIALLNQLKARTKAPKAEEVDPVIRLLEAAQEAAQPYLTESPADA